MTELKPCPFCNRSVKKHSNKVIECEYCGYSFVMTEYTIYANDETIHFERKIEETWNRRVNE